MKEYLRRVSCWLLIAASTGILFNSLSSAQEKTPDQVYQEASKSIVFISSKITAGDKYFGSGFVVGPEGFVVTNHHVIFPNRYDRVNPADFMVRDVQGLTYSIDKFVYCDPDPDICILKINDTRLPALKLGDSSAVKVGQVVYTIGSPQGYDFSFSNGLISGLRNYDGNKWLQFTAPISSGNSGGPLLNKEGQAIGVISWQAAKGQNLNFALAINAVKPIFKKYYA